MKDDGPRKRTTWAASSLVGRGCDPMESLQVYVHTFHYCLSLVFPGGIKSKSRFDNTIP